MAAGGAVPSLACGAELDVAAGRHAERCLERPGEVGLVGEAGRECGFCQGAAPGAASSGPCRGAASPSTAQSGSSCRRGLVVGLVALAMSVACHAIWAYEQGSWDCGQARGQSAPARTWQAGARRAGA